MHIIHIQVYKYYKIKKQTNKPKHDIFICLDQSTGNL